jgi:RNA 3'-terminal phosphate cyclase (ATP)
VNRLGPHVEASLERPGFFPAGGGRFTAKVTPARQLGGLELTDRGDIAARRVRAVVANLPEHIAERECETIARKSGWDTSCFQTQIVYNSPGPGNVVMIELESEHVTEVFTGFGQKGVRAERVAEQVWTEAQRYLDAGVPVGEHLADQLMLPLGMAAHFGTGGGTFRTLDLTQHATTHAEILKRFLNVAAHIETDGRDDVLIQIR